MYEVPSPNPGQRLGWRGTIEIQPPKVSDTEVLQSQWTLFLPKDFRYVKFGGAMREEITDRGWDTFFGGLQLFVPHVGPALATPEESQQTAPPELPAVKTAGFDTHIQKEGVSVTLRRLDAPSEIAVAYRGKTYAATLEAIACLLAFFGGVRLLGRSRQTRFAYFILVGVGALIVAGAVNPRAAGVWQSIYVGVLLALFVWLAFGLWALLRTTPARIAPFFKRKPKQKTQRFTKEPPPVTTPPPIVPPPPGPQPPPVGPAL